MTETKEYWKRTAKTSRKHSVDNQRVDYQYHEELAGHELQKVCKEYMSEKEIKELWSMATNTKMASGTKHREGMRSGE